MRVRFALGLKPDHRERNIATLRKWSRDTATNPSFSGVDVSFYSKNATVVVEFSGEDSFLVHKAVRSMFPMHLDFFLENFRWVNISE